MNKCFIEFPKHNLYICYDDVFCYINLVLSKQDDMYIFIQFVYPRNHVHFGIKQVKEFKNKDSVLYKQVYDCINDILNDPIDHDSFQYILLPNVLKDDNYLEICLCRSNNYHDTFVVGISVSRLNTKIPLLYHVF